MKTNWELSGVRASRVVTVFEGFGYTKNLLTAVGYGDARPVVPNRDANGVGIEANRTQNRRVVIKLIKPNENMLESTVSQSIPVEEVKK
jgi:chemotaxis protein MotB